MKKARVLSVSLVAVVALFAASAASAREGDCDASVQATLETSEQGEVTRLEFAVEISTSENCAGIEYDLILEELLPNRQTKQVRVPRFVKLDDGSFDEVVVRKMPSSCRLVSHDARIVSCRKCTITP